MDQVTQQNAALVEEAAAASHAMQEQAAQLAQAVSVFKLDGGAATAAGTRAPAQPAKPPVAAARRRAIAAPAATSDWEAF
jgi:hypothetical protein